MARALSAAEGRPAHRTLAGRQLQRRARARAAAAGRDLRARRRPRARRARSRDAGAARSRGRRDRVRRFSPRSARQHAAQHRGARPGVRRAATRGRLQRVLAGTARPRPHPPEDGPPRRADGVPRKPRRPVERLLRNDDGHARQAARRGRRRQRREGPRAGRARHAEPGIPAEPPARFLHRHRDRLGTHAAERAAAHRARRRRVAGRGRALVRPRAPAPDDRAAARGARTSRICDLASLLQLAVQCRRGAGDGEVAASGPVRGSRSASHVRHDGAPLPAGCVERRVLDSGRIVA